MDTLRKPPRQSVIAGGNEIDWATAEKAARDIVKVCEDSYFTPPEAVDLHQIKISRVCQAMNAIVDALRIRAGKDAL